MVEHKFEDMKINLEDILQAIWYWFLATLFLSFIFSSLLEGKKSTSYHWIPKALPNIVMIIIQVIIITIGIIAYLN